MIIVKLYLRHKIRPVTLSFGSKELYNQFIASIFTTPKFIGAGQFIFKVDNIRYVITITKK